MKRQIIRIINQLFCIYFTFYALVDLENQDGMSTRGSLWNVFKASSKVEIKKKKKQTFIQM